MLVQRVLDEAAFTMRQVAEYTGVSYQAVRRWKAGQRVPETESRLLLADAFDEHAERLRKLADELREDAGKGEG